MLSVSAQNSQDLYITDWSIAGVPEKNNDRPKGNVILTYLPDEYYELDFVKDLNGDNTGTKDNSELLNEFLNVNTAPVRIRFSSGTFLFNGTIRLRSNVILEGYSPTLTIFKFDLKNQDKNLIEIVGQQDPVYHLVRNPFPRGDRRMIMYEIADLEVGDNIDLEQRNSDYMFYYTSHNQPWAEWSVGQMLKISKISKDTIFFDRTLTNTYDADLDLRLSKVKMAENILLERFSIIRLDKGLGNNFFLRHAADVKLKCIVSKYGTRSHVRIERSRNVELTGNYFYDAHFHCGGGAGYGILVKSHATECLIANNIFQNLRHAMIIKEGANRNVFSYNYSSHVKISDGNISNRNCYNERISDFPDISVHGHYSYLNLFEGNIVQAIHSADNWGPTGPGTTFIRNVIESEYGIKISMGSEVHNLFGNVLYNGFIKIDTTVKKTVQVQNFIRNYMQSNFLNNLPNSFYLENAPDFYDYSVWPSVDPKNPTKSTNPAKERWIKQIIFDESCCGKVPGLNSYITTGSLIDIFYEKGYLYIEKLNGTINNLNVYNLDGILFFKAENFNTSDPTYIGNLDPGLYIANFYNQEEIYRVKFVVKN